MEVIDAPEIQSQTNQQDSDAPLQAAKSLPVKDKGKKRTGSITVGVSSSISSIPQQSTTHKSGKFWYQLLEFYLIIFIDSVTALPGNTSGPDTPTLGANSITTNPTTTQTQLSSRRRKNFDETEDLSYVSPQPITLEDRSASQDPQSVGVWAKDVHVGNYTVIQGNTKLGAYVVWTVEIEVLKPVEEEEEGCGDDSVGKKKNKKAGSGIGSDDGSDSEPEPGPQDINWSLHSPHIPNSEGPLSPTVSSTGSNGTPAPSKNQSPQIQSQIGQVPIPHSHYNGVHQVITIRRRYSEFYTLRERLWYAYPRQRHGIPELPPKSVVSKFREGFLENRRRGLEFFLLTVLLNPVFARSPIVKEFVRGERR